MGDDDNDRYVVLLGDVVLKTWSDQVSLNLGLAVG